MRSEKGEPKEVIHMLRKTIYCFLGTIALLVIGAVLGLIIGAIIGGNYMAEFEFGGVRGYEAVGRVGIVIGVAVGALLSTFLWVRLVKGSSLLSNSTHCPKRKC